MIRINALRHILDPVGQKGNSQTFDIEFVKLSTGQYVTGHCICLSSHFEKDLATIRFTNSGETRTIHISLIQKYNGEKIL